MGSVLFTVFAGAGLAAAAVAVAILVAGPALQAAGKSTTSRLARYTSPVEFFLVLFVAAAFLVLASVTKFLEASAL